MDMTLEEQWEALECIAPVELKLRQRHVTHVPRWYASQSYVNRGGDGFLGSITGNGDTPQQAISALWEQARDLGKSSLFIVHDPPGGPRRHFRWAGFMWKELPREAQP
jgi:hypothetical protein